ncbi:MAG: NAD(+)/NADH kinase [Desulfosoma sp.]
MSGSVGIVANPASGKDIRRLVAHGSVFDNQEKVRIVRRILMGLEAVGVQSVFYMPDAYAIVDRALRGCSVAMDVNPVPMAAQDSQEDSVKAAAWMETQRVGCLVVLGGDGTCRAVTKGTRSVPLLPISTGTNNVFPHVMEATIAGLAAGLVATGAVPLEESACRVSCLEVLCDNSPGDLALVDVAVCEGSFIGARAIWEVEKVRQLFLSRCRPESIGLSALGGQLTTIGPSEPTGLHMVMGAGGPKISAAIAPGLIRSVSVERFERMIPGKPYPVLWQHSVLALDGEREMEVKRSMSVAVRLSLEGPFVVSVPRVMERARDKGVFVEQRS